MDDAVESEKRQRMQIQSMTAKCELKQYIADEAEKEKKLLETKLEQANREIKELIDANEIHQ